jgi:hypothetical protein
MVLRSPGAARWPCSIGNFPADDIQRVLNINERLLAEAIDAARSGLREERPAP